MKKVYIVLYLALLLIPLLTLFVNEKGFSNLLTNFSGAQSALYLLVRLFALYGIILLFVQTILGSNMRYFIEVFGGGIYRYHMTQGVIAYLIILLHPFFFTFFNIQTSGINSAVSAILPNFGSRMQNLILFGEIGLLFLTIGVITGILGQHQLIISYWRKLHILNYFVFPLILVHSFFIGQDVRSSIFVFLYPIFILIYLIIVFKKLLFRNQG